jgi:hypothetical protein
MITAILGKVQVILSPDAGDRAHGGLVLLCTISELPGRCRYLR